VAKEGSISKASEVLHLTPQTISGQISLLEERINVELFTKLGRNLELTPAGKLVFEYAEDIFTLGSELEELLESLPTEQTIEFKVGVIDSIHKSIVYRLLAPALETSKSIRIICSEGNMEELLLDLAVHKIDLVIADSPITTNIKVKGYSHPLGECGISFFAHPKIKKLIGNNFPDNLNGAPLLIPSKIASIHNPLIAWFKAQNVTPKIVGEFDDTALMKAFGRGGRGVFIAPSPIAKEVEHEYGVKEIGSTTEIIEKFYAISVERKIIHPAVLVITLEAKDLLFNSTF
jgi:LysR family transcriptional activator of nhaA